MTETAFIAALVLPHLVNEVAAGWFGACPYPTIYEVVHWSNDNPPEIITRGMWKEMSPQEQHVGVKPYSGIDVSNM